MIKDQDLLGVLRSDVGLFAFDGTELDPGTVTEFLAAKFLDVPAVIYRSDFRGGSGEEDSSSNRDRKDSETGNKWNLMVSFYPRTKVVYFNGMVEYQKIYRENMGKPADVIACLYSDFIARKLVDAMDEVVKMPRLFEESELPKKQEDFKKVFGITYE